MYRVGDTVVHPLHGAGEIHEIEERTVGNAVKLFYVMHISKCNMTVKTYNLISNFPLKT